MPLTLSCSASPGQGCTSSLLRVLQQRTSANAPASSRAVTYKNHMYRRLAGTPRKAEWWAERTYRFGTPSVTSHLPQAVLSYEIVTKFQMNQYLLGCLRSGKAAIFDTGCCRASMETAKNLGLQIEYLFQTHAHIDHIAGLAEIKESALADVPIYLHPADLPWYLACERQAEIFGMHLRQPPPIDVELCDGDVLSVGAIELKVIHTPGHCPGHVCFYNEQHGFLIAGDLLFRGSVGRTDFPLSDPAAMKESIRKIMRLPDETRVFPGHMMPTSIGHERRHNPHVHRALGL